MFGYVRPFMPALSAEQRAEYKSVYCGLCRVLGTRYGRAYRFVLSYDIVYLSMLHRQCVGGAASVSTVRCPVNPLHKTPAVAEDESLLYAARIFAIIFYHKLQDEIADSGWLKALFVRLLSLFFWRGYRRACRGAPDFSALVETEMARQAALEQADETSVDAACEPTARILAGAFGAICDDPAVQPRLSRLGLLLGRFIYLADAAADLRRDAKHKSYNPYLLPRPKGALTTQMHEALLRRCEQSMNATLYGVCESYEAMALPGSAVIDNITILGLEQIKTLIVTDKENKRPWTLSKRWA